MEDTLRVTSAKTQKLKTLSLNPCFNGRYSQRAEITAKTAEDISLNPCFNGRYSQRKFGSKIQKPNKS